MQSAKWLYTAEQVRELDRIAIEEYGLASTLLMKRAGRAAFDALTRQWPSVASVHVFCGSGNNGGDGYIVAALAAQRGLDVVVWELSTRLADTAQAACAYAVQEGVPMRAFTLEHWQAVVAGAQQPGVIVDGLLGTGSSGALRPHYIEAIQAINDCGWSVLALDIPSGVQANTGAVDDIAINAKQTVSFIGQKLGNRIGKGRLASGDCIVSDLQVSEAVYRQVSASAQIIDLSTLLRRLPTAVLDSHKGDSGHVLVIGGDSGFGGAVIMAGEMAARAGTGLVGVATRPEHISAIIARQPELMAVGVNAGQELVPLLEKPSVLVVGPGLGRASWSEQLLYFALEANKPMVLDADALNLLSAGRIPWPKEKQWVLTPHPGEAARLLGTTIHEVQRDRIAAVTALQSRFGGAVILKGAGSLVMTSDQQLHLCEQGNPGMASGGMGDVLSGLLGALLAQGLSIDEAACLGVVLHAQAGDCAAEEKGQRALLATDLIDYIPALMNIAPPRDE